LQTYLIHIKRLVQGVGFRPFVHRVASASGISGEADNRNNGVFIKINSSKQKLQDFINELKFNAP